ncbi:hypothetical protein [Variovorax rhizosphaerae]|uniref:Uncharacterized protein n=1 Tax=Variovorax rhizosphaerae TaxID=1836200 RepID=A0ABU8WMH6_9BURK
MTAPSREHGRPARAFRFVETAARWLSAGVGALVMIVYSIGGAIGGDLSVVLGGVGVGGVLLGWVLAVRRLDSSLRTLRERLPEAGPLEPAVLHDGPRFKGTSSTASSSRTSPSSPSAVADSATTSGRSGAT